MSTVRDNLNAGKYKNKVPFPSGIIAADRENLTGRQVREHREAERTRHHDGRLAWSAGERAACELLRSDLEAEYGIVRNPKAEKLWSLAWDHGHGGGYGDVISSYEDFVELVVE